MTEKKSRQEAAVTGDKVWTPKERMDHRKMNQRMRNCTTFFAWQEAIRWMQRRKGGIKGVRIAEVGCGTGTFSLTFALLGAKVCLLDQNTLALQGARDIYRSYGVKVETVLADCSKELASDLKGRFDVVISVGLAEHFEGENRNNCLRYHKDLLDEGGSVFIGVPNALCPGYQLVRGIRTLTGTWEIELEIPYTPAELLRRGKEIGLVHAKVIGNSPLADDARNYTWGIASALKDALPSFLASKLKRKKQGETGDGEKQTVEQEDNKMVEEIRHYLQQKSDDVTSGRLTEARGLVNTFSAGIYLCGEKKES